MKLFWGPHTCAIGAHIILEETGKPYQIEKLDVAGGETHKAPSSRSTPRARFRLSSATTDRSLPNSAQSPLGLRALLRTRGFCRPIPIAKPVPLRSWTTSWARSTGKVSGGFSSRRNSSRRTYCTRPPGSVLGLCRNKVARWFRRDHKQANDISRCVGDSDRMAGRN